MTDEDWTAAEREPAESEMPEAIAEEETGEEHAPSGAGFVRWLFETLLLLGAAFLLAQGVRTYVVQPYVIPTGSMEPTIMAHDRVLVNRFVYRFGSPAHGDVVVFRDPTGETPALLKRVIATGGETIDVRGRKVVRDGLPLDEPYTHDLPSTPGAVALPITIPEGQLWLMGDNRTNSKDSRWIGPQPVSSVAGKAFFVYWPPEHFGPLD